MACKRPFDDAESFENDIALKQPRQELPLTHLSPFEETFLFENGSSRFVSGETVNNFSQCQVGRLAAEETGDECLNVKTAENTVLDYRSAVNSEAVFGETERYFDQCKVRGLGVKEITYEHSNEPREVNQETNFSTLCNDSSCLWVKNDAFEAYEEANESVHKHVFPHFFDLDLHGFCSTLTEHTLRKTVPVGPEFQADIPDWDPQNLSEYSSKQFSGGICITPIPVIEPSVFTTSTGVGNEDSCRCPDKGSIRCVRQHVKVSRDNLCENFGQKQFEELGFCDMGEVVAERWSNEEEKMFHDVVFSNKVSSGKNYWDSLALSFPNRSKMELVSYYFNVFKLRQRAEQNRIDPMNVNSDDDEWLGFEAQAEENDDDGFAVESSVGQDTLVRYQTTHENNILCDIGNGIVSEIASQEQPEAINTEKLVSEEEEGKFYDVSEVQVGESFNGRASHEKDILGENENGFPGR